MTAVRTSKRSPADIQSGKPGSKPFRVPFGQGLFLWVTPRGPNTEGTRSWRCKFKIDGRERLIVLGHYPAMSLAEAHDERLRVRRNTAKGVDSLTERRAEQERELARRTQTFEPMAKAWIATRKADWAPNYASEVARRFGYCYPAFGNRPIGEIKRRDIIAVLEQIKAEHGVWSMNHTRQHLDLAFQYWMLQDDIDRNPVAGLSKAQQFKLPDKSAHPAAVLIEDARAVLAAIEQARTPADLPVSRMALLANRFQALVGLRPSEAHGARWVEFRGDVWTVPAERMKGRRGRQKAHTVYLSRQAREVLEAARTLQGPGNGHGYVFAIDRPLSRSTVWQIMQNALRGKTDRFGHPLRHVPHGWRSSMDTILNQKVRNRQDIIDLMLAHENKGRVAGIYNRTKHETHFPTEARRLWQIWADHLLQGAPDAFALADIKRSNVVRLARKAKVGSEAFIGSMREAAD